MSDSPASPARFPLIEISTVKLDFQDHVTTFSTEMALIHNVFIRGLNCIWEYAPVVKKGDECAFAGYSLTWAGLVHDHHHGEEDIIFPFLQEKFDMGHNVEQHKEFLQDLATFEEYMTGVFQKKLTYDGEKARQLVEAFGDSMVSHLHEEIPTISPERLGEYDKVALDKMIKIHDDHIKSQSMFTAFSLVATHHDFQGVPSWPPMPAPVIWIIRNVGYWRYRSYWKFAPYTRYGKAQKYV
ncbi:hypothetical protein B0H34DRAFT_800413 [Crassisporium funariophilum]|nr:hypothetical protein B0H34DRAFT_800413 [Crassisporium funariophilum]